MFSLAISVITISSWIYALMTLGWAGSVAKNSEYHALSLFVSIFSHFGMGNGFRETFPAHVKYSFNKPNSWMYYSFKIAFNWFCECFLSKAPVLYSICQDITNKFGFAINFEWIFLEAHEKIQSIFAKWIYFLVCRMNLMGTYDAIANVSSRITAYIPWSSYKLNYVTFDITSTNDRSIYWQYDLLHLLSLFDELK